MSAAIHTRYGSGARGSYIRAWTKDGKGAMALRVPYAYELHHSRRHPAAAKALAEKLGWSGFWIIGHNEDNSICAVQAPHSTTENLYQSLEGDEGDEWFFVEEKR